MAGNNRTAQGRAERRLLAALMGLWAIYQTIAGLYFIFVRPSHLPEDLRAAATSLRAINAAAPHIETWLNWVFDVLGGQMAALGVLVLGAAVSVLRGHRPGTVEMVTFVTAGLLSVTLMSGVNFALGSDFRWFLVAPVIVWLAAMILLGRRVWAAQRHGEGESGGN